VPFSSPLSLDPFDIAGDDRVGFINRVAPLLLNG
jgi:hypothetical protein